MALKTRDEVVISRGDGEAVDETVGVEAPVAPAYGACKAAAEAAADQYGVDELEKHAEAIATAWEEVLMRQIKGNRAKARKTEGEEAAGPITFPGPYQWWNVLLAGPFQLIAPLGPFLPHKIIARGEPAFMIAAIVRNPNPLPFGPNPSAAQIMTGMQYRARLQTGNLTIWDPGPNFTVDGTFTPGFVNFELFVLSGFNAPATHEADLYEANLTLDVKGPGMGLPPFAGYSTWVLDPDIELPDLFTPGQGPQLQHDIPARFLIYE